MILPHPDHYSISAPVVYRPAPGRVARRPEAGRLSTTERTEIADLVVRAQAGELAAQNELVRRYTRRLSGYARTITHQPDAIEDVVQMVFIKMFRRLNRLRDPASFESWLFRLSRNTAVDFIRRRRCRPVTVPAENELHEIPDPTNANTTSEIMDALEAALAQVSPKDRELVTLFVQGNSYQSLAKRNGLTMGAVKARLHRMRPFLRSFVGGVTETRIDPSDRWRAAAGTPVAA